MNVTTVCTRIKLDLGIYGIALPIDNLDDFILMILQDITLPTFSIYNPFEQRLHVQLADLQKIQKTHIFESYLLPDFQERKLLEVRNVEYDDSSIFPGGYAINVFPYAGFSIAQDVMTGQASADLVSAMLPTLTFHFEYPRTLILYNCLSSYSLVLTLCFEHDKSFMSIPPTAEESFFKLAILDVKWGLYGLMKHHNNIQTSYANIEMKIDDWQNAVEERKSLLQDWDERYHLDHCTFYYG